MGHVISAYSIVSQDGSAVHLLIQKACLHMKESHWSRFRYAALAFCLSLLSGASSLNAQSSTGAEYEARAARLVQAGDLKGAEAEMRRAVELLPREVQYHLRLGVILAMQRRPQAAAECFERALALDPENLAARRHLAGSQWQLGRLASAQGNLEIILKADPGDSQSLLLLSKVFIDARHYAAALVLARQAAEGMPSSYQAYSVKGMAEMRLQRYTDSAKSYARAAELNPNAVEINLGLAMSLWAAGSIAESFATFEQGLKRFPGDAYHCLEYGRLLLKSAKPNDSTAETRAIALLQTALKLKPSLPEAHYLLGDLALRRGNPEEALVHLEQAVKLDPEGTKIHFALFRTYRRLGRKEDAAREEEAFQKLKAKEETAPAAPLLARELN